eukprot:6199714-Pleurochrysis_carterae.AAC.4
MALEVAFKCASQLPAHGEAGPARRLVHHQYTTGQRDCWFRFRSYAHGRIIEYLPSTPTASGSRSHNRLHASA